MDKAGKKHRQEKIAGQGHRRSGEAGHMAGSGRRCRGILCAIFCWMCLAACGDRSTEEMRETLADREEATGVVDGDAVETELDSPAGNPGDTPAGNPGNAVAEDPGGTVEGNSDAMTGTQDAGKQAWMQKNAETFAHLAQEAGLEAGEQEAYFQRLCQEDIFAGGDMELVDFILEDLDGNGQEDMVAMVQNPGTLFEYGTGCLYFYMNEDAPYCFQDEEFPFFFRVDLSSGDLDGDGNVEIVFGAQGTGNGGAGDWHYRLLKYKDHAMEQMELPSDSYETQEREIGIQVIQETKKDTYRAYCPTLDESVTFTSENRMKPEREAMQVGGNCRGFYQVECVEYEGGGALQAAEYLFGEGGIVHGVGAAWFLFTWDQEGEWRIVKWWVEPW